MGNRNQGSLLHMRRKPLIGPHRPKKISEIVKEITELHESKHGPTFETTVKKMSNESALKRNPAGSKHSNPLEGKRVVESKSAFFLKIPVIPGAMIKVKAGLKSPKVKKDTGKRNP